MFDSIRGQTKWNIDGEMLWGYFFFDPRPEKLRAAATELKSNGYRFVDLYEVEGKTGEFVLHVERVERHTVDSLDARNGQLQEFAARHDLLKYDGMDVGPVPPRP